MMDRQYMQAHPEVDWGVYNKQQSVPPELQDYRSSQEGQDGSNMGTPLGNSGKMVDTFLGKMPANIPSMSLGTPENKQMINEMIGMAAGGPGMKILGEGINAAKPAVMNAATSAYDYMNPSRGAEAFRSTLGSGTSSQNISNLAQRAQFAKQSAKSEALIPKDQLYSQEGGSNVYKVDPSNLPEGNLDKFSYMIAPQEKFGASQASALSQAIAKYRKTGNIDDFNDTAESIFNIPELGENAADKVEDALSMPTKRDSAYFSDPDVTAPYSNKGQVMQLHNQYQSSPTMNNYQDLRSAITTQMRKLKTRATTDDVAAEKYDQMKSNLSNLDSDANNFIQTLPQNMQDLDSQFRQKYTQFAKTYNKGDKETGASLTLRRLAEGRHDLVDDNDVVNLFSNPTAADKQAILDMGDSAGRNAVYAALQRVPSGNAEKMANTVLDLKRTKGFDNIITTDMENWANNMLHQVRLSSNIKKGLGSVGGAALGGAVAGPLGAGIGLALPWGKEYLPAFGKILASKFKK